MRTPGMTLSPKLSPSQIQELATCGYLERAEPVSSRASLGPGRRTSDETVCGGVLTEATGALHQGSGLSERAGRSEAPTATAPSAGPMVALRADRLGRSGLRADGG